MLKQKIIERISDTDRVLGIDSSRCSRARFSQSPCRRCMENCLKDAIRLNGGVRLDEIQCSECMSCVSLCPTGALKMNLNIFSLISRLEKTRFPVLGCHHKPDILCHAKTPCFGFLSEEILIAFSGLIKNPIQINLTGCSGCENGYIRDFLKERCKRIQEKISINIEEKIRLVEKEEDLDFQEETIDRRSFFRSLKTNISKEAFSLLENNQSADTSEFYGSKVISSKRDLLNKSVPAFSEREKKKLFQNYYFSVVIDEPCEKCFACIGVCPSGALKIEENGSQEEVFFNASLCNGCGLCGSFCTKGSITIKSFQGLNPFGFVSAEKLPFKNVKQIN